MGRPTGTSIMRVSFASRRAACLAALALPAGAAQAEAARFTKVFATGHAPATLHAHVLYKGSDGSLHRMSLWRSGDRLLRRDTDSRLTTIVTHRPHDLAYRLDLFDHARRLHTIVDRESLYQVGRFTDWSAMAYGLQTPTGRYAIRPVSQPPIMPTVAPCRWFELGQPGRTTRICWSEALAFPLMIASAGGQIVWRVTDVDRKPLPSAIFRLNPAGYTLNDAAQDLKRD